MLMCVHGIMLIGWLDDRSTLLSALRSYIRIQTDEEITITVQNTHDGMSMRQCYYHHRYFKYRVKVFPVQ